MRYWTPGKIRALKGQRKFATVTCYDATSAALIEALAPDTFPLVLVGDSLGNVMQGHDTALPVTVEHIIYHAQCVGRTLRTPLLLKGSAQRCASSRKAARMQSNSKVANAVCRSSAVWWRPGFRCAVIWG